MAKELVPMLHLDYNLVDTTFDKFTNFSGDLTFDHSLKINGKFNGKIVTKGFLYIGKTAIVEADIEASIVILEGKVTGDVIAHERMEMLASGELYGDLKTAKLKIADSVVFEGNCTMIKDDSKKVEEKPKVEEKKKSVDI